MAFRLLLFFVLSSLVSQAQNSLFKQWDKRFGGTDWDILYAIQQTTDGGFILGGTSYSTAGGDKTQPSRGNYDYWIIKIDSLGAKQWDKRFGGNDDDELRCLQQTTDGGFILGGFSQSGITGDKSQGTQGSFDYWIVKVDSSGLKQWDKTYGGNTNDYLFAVQQANDGGYILGGYSGSGAGGDKSQSCRGGYDYWIVKTDSAGNKQWDKTIGGTSSDIFTSLQQTHDDGYILAGSSTSNIGAEKTQNTIGYSDYWMVKIDALGNPLWDKDFGGTNTDYLNSIQNTIDGGFILAGYSFSSIGGDKSQAGWGGFDYWILKTDSSGNKLWDKDFGGTGDENSVGNIIQTNDNGFLIAGTSTSNMGGDKSENNLGPEQTWIIKTDYWGNKEWDKTIFTNAQDKAGYAIQKPDGRYVFANYTLADTGGYKAQPTQGGYDYWTIQFRDTAAAVIPHSNFTSSDSDFCTEPVKCISFYDHSSSHPITWNWSFPGGNPSSSTLQNPTNICYYFAGTFPVSLVTTNAAGSDTLTITSMITVGDAPPPPTITVLGADTLISSNAVSYQWYYNGNSVSGATDSSYVGLQSGTYAVMIADSHHCSRLSAGAYIDITSIHSLSSSNLIAAVLPNPNHGKFSVLFNHASTNAVIKVLNIFGEEIYSAHVQDTVSKTNISLHVSAGIYYVVITNDEKSLIRKLVIK